MPRPETVDDYIRLHPDWTAALTKLRRILTATPLDETIKWGAPCYTLDGKHVVGIAAFSRYVALWFHQGVFLSDPDGVLVNAQEGKTKALRQWRFTTDEEIVVARVKAYVREAIDNQRQGKQVAPDRAKPVVVPPELAAALAKNARARKSFAALTKGRQREYAEHVASAKRESTKAARIAKILPLVESGRGLHDKYREC